MNIWQLRLKALKRLACLIAPITLLWGCSSTNSNQQLREQAAQLHQATPSSSSKFATNKGLEEFEDEPQPQYTLGPGDEVTVTVWAHPEISGPRVVGPDGDVLLPFVGSIKFADLTADEAGGTVTQILSDYYVKPVATVTVDSYSGNNLI